VSGCLCITAATHSHVFCCVVKNKTAFSVICASLSFVTIFFVENQKYSHTSVDLITVYGKKDFFPWDMTCVS
jgi:hypothetical protein